MINMFKSLLKRILLSLFSDTEFMMEFMNKAMVPYWYHQLDKDKKYIIFTRVALDRGVEREFVNLLKGYDVVLLTGIDDVKFLELDMESE